jgi:hypothetical protein
LAHEHICGMHLLFKKHPSPQSIVVAKLPGIVDTGIGIVKRHGPIKDIARQGFLAKPDQALPAIGHRRSLFCLPYLSYWRLLEGAICIAYKNSLASDVAVTSVF